MRLSDTFDRLRREHRKAMIPFITVGYPDPDRFVAVANIVCNSGADILEVGFPHSDPLADGPVIQQSSHQAIANGFTTNSAFAALKAISLQHQTPIVVMCYSNLILRTGARQFVSKCRASNVAGLIVPDMIIEESTELRVLCERSDIAFVNLVTPVTPPARTVAIARSGSGFLYFVSVTGTTGMRAKLDSSIAPRIRAIRKLTSLPICVGFGISSPELAAQAAEISDGVIIGSRILQLIAQDDGTNEYPSLRSFLTEVRTALGGKS